ncbi:DNA/RNA helicase of superfamily II [Pseudomonas sessilinigenes]|nr:DNA/RNA helicase of superfamily II [Pseudomonas sessilinigenes]
MPLIVSRCLTGPQSADTLHNLLPRAAHAKQAGHHRACAQTPLHTMNRPDLCPACGARNDCTLADPRSADRACWCYSVSIDPAVIEALPQELRNQSCLCPRCAGVEAQLRTAQAPRS